MRIRSGAPPADCAAADTGAILATVNLPADWMAAAAGGTKSMLGTWEDLLADAGGIAGHYRIYNNGDTECHEQGTVTGTGGGGDLEVSNTNFAQNQPFSITNYTKTAGNA